LQFISALAKSIVADHAAPSELGGGGVRLFTADPARSPSGLLVGRALSSTWAWASAIGALALIFALDRVTTEAPVEHLYYLPIILASVRFGFRGTVLTSSAAILLYHLANPHVLTLAYEESDIVQILLFAGIGVVSAKMANDARRLHELATTDDLTGLHNLRSFEAQLCALVSAARRGSPLAVLVLDVDQLKALNDAHGHLAGADAVRAVGRVIAERAPLSAVACRFGGDEFVIALPNHTERRAERVAERLREAVRAAAPVLAGEVFPPRTLSISVGVASLRPSGRPGDSTPDLQLGERLFRAADGALYAAKAAGRNRVASAPPITAGRCGGGR
jgi:diguanylate cyclase (GGDEF)-like protein